VRVTKGGKIDRGFGRDGSLTTGFHRKAGARADQVLVDGRGRILVSGVFNDPRYSLPTGIALARYSAGR
jgi:hypothetical protein